MPALRDRFEAKVDRSGEHHLWTGFKKAEGAGKLKVDGKAVTAQRVALGTRARTTATRQRGACLPRRQGARADRASHRSANDERASRCAQAQAIARGRLEGRGPAWRVEAERQRGSL
jgi:hypothetical protein